MAAAGVASDAAGFAFVPGAVDVAFEPAACVFTTPVPAVLDGLGAPDDPPNNEFNKSEMVAGTGAG